MSTLFVAVLGQQQIVATWIWNTR